MNTDMVRSFLDRGLIRAGTEIDATYRGTDMAGYPFARGQGMFLVREVKLHPSQGYLFVCASGEDGSRQVIRGEDIYGVDGMAPERLVESFGKNF